MGTVVLFDKAFQRKLLRDSKYQSLECILFFSAEFQVVYSTLFRYLTCKSAQEHTSQLIRSP